MPQQQPACLPACALSSGKREEDAFHDLSERELDVLYEVSLGKTNAEIAQSLNLSEKTARNYVSVILEKLQLSNRIELATYAIKHHLSERMKPNNKVNKKTGRRDFSRRPVLCLYQNSIWLGRPWASPPGPILDLFLLLTEQGSEPGYQEIVCAKVAGNFPGQHQEYLQIPGTSG